MLYFNLLLLFWPNIKNNLHFINSFTRKAEKIVQNSQNDSQSILAFVENETLYKDNLKELNKTQVYLIVSESKKKSQNNLLLIQTQERLNAEKLLHRKRFDKVFLKGRQKGYDNGAWYDKKTFEIYRGIDLNPAFRPNTGSGLAEYFRSGNFYFPNNLGGRKSICPVFFDPEAAEIFLLNVYEESLEILAGFPNAIFVQKFAKKQLLKKIANTKIISIGLGDFLEYYSNSSKSLQKTEFLFFPTYKDLLNKFEKIRLPLKNKAVVFESFYSYQKKFLLYKKNT